MTQDDRVIVEHLAVEIAKLQAENNREQWAENEGDDDGILRTVATTFNIISTADVGFPGIRQHLVKMLKKGEISVRSTLNDMPPLKSSDISANLGNWYVSQEDAKKVRGYLIPGKRENNSTAHSGTTGKAAPDVAPADDEQPDVWIIRAREIANGIWLRKLNICEKPTKEGIAPEIARRLWDSQVVTKTGKRISADYILRFALRNAWHPPAPD